VGPIEGSLKPLDNHGSMILSAWHGRVVKGMGLRLCGASSISALLGRVSQKRKLTD